MTPSSSKNLGTALIIIPPVSLGLSLILWPIFNFVFRMYAMSGDASPVVGRVINVALGFLGLVGVLGIFTALPIGIFLLAKGSKAKETPKV
ncbi:hypothetical protein KBD34_02765 [Patescibacteria group bacterium]|nr:hypothetical protein [Patescibacteria group bacterium]